MEEKNTKNNKSNNKNNKAAEKEEMVSISKREYDALKSKSEERDSYYDNYLRAHAEVENVRKRLEKEKMDFLKFANEGLILDFLPILDNLEIAEKHIKEAKDFKAVQEGVDMIQQQMQEFLKDIGIERIKALGGKFDPHLHEAIEIEESNDKDEGIIVEELKPGYRLDGRLLRPASVKIAKRKQHD